jgi:hypothetical protein
MFDQDLPNCLKNRVSAKRISLAALESMIKAIKQQDHDSQPQIGLLTAAGIIVGEPVDIAIEKDDFVKMKQTSENPDGTKRIALSVDISYVAYQGRNEILKNAEEKGYLPEIIDNGAFLNLKNVSLRPFSNMRDNINFEQLLVFVDQIIAFCLVDRQSYENQLQS